MGTDRPGTISRGNTAVRIENRRGIKNAKRSAPKLLGALLDCRVVDPSLDGVGRFLTQAAESLRREADDCYERPTASLY